MLLIWLVSGMIRLPLALLTLFLLIPVTILFVIVTSPVRIFGKEKHEELCDAFMSRCCKIIKFVGEGRA